ncbi:techylectin-5B-like, partial [Actinia tenebrosa]|uniref:Techylectin-5B-like n=1 Tax=Actinia tenebrosa TaxID=6105 RepID=A0A6P8ILJ4_ACTTE
RLRVDMEDFEGNTRYADYGLFKVADESVNYRLTVGQYTGNAGDSMAVHNGMEFSTRDADHDRDNAKSCAVAYTSAWWYNSCLFTNPNGQYYYTNPSPFLKGIIWYYWRNDDYSMKRMEIKIRPVA